MKTINKIILFIITSVLFISINMTVLADEYSGAAEPRFRLVESHYSGNRGATASGSLSQVNGDKNAGHLTAD